LLFKNKFIGNHTGFVIRFYFEAPCGVCGKLFNRIVLTKYMRRFLSERNEVIKAYAESAKADKFPALK